MSGAEINRPAVRRAGEQPCPTPHRRPHRPANPVSVAGHPEAGATPAEAPATPADPERARLERALERAEKRRAERDSDRDSRLVRRARYAIQEYDAQQEKARREAPSYTTPAREEIAARLKITNQRIADSQRRYGNTFGRDISQQSAGHLELLMYDADNEPDIEKRVAAAQKAVQLATKRYMAASYAVDDARRYNKASRKADERAASATRRAARGQLASILSSKEGGVAALRTIINPFTKEPILSQEEAAKRFDAFQERKEELHQNRADLKAKFESGQLGRKQYRRISNRMGTTWDHDLLALTKHKEEQLGAEYIGKQKTIARLQSQGYTLTFDDQGNITGQSRHNTTRIDNQDGTATVTSASADTLADRGYTQTAAGNFVAPATVEPAAPEEPASTAVDHREAARFAAGEAAKQERQERRDALPAPDAAYDANVQLLESHGQRVDDDWSPDELAARAATLSEGVARRDEGNEAASRERAVAAGLDAEDGPQDVAGVNPGEAAVARSRTVQAGLDIEDGSDTRADAPQPSAQGFDHRRTAAPDPDGSFEGFDRAADLPGEIKLGFHREAALRAAAATEREVPTTTRGAGLIDPQRGLGTPDEFVGGRGSAFGGFDRGG